MRQNEHYATLVDVMSHAPISRFSWLVCLAGFLSVMFSQPPSQSESSGTWSSRKYDATFALDQLGMQSIERLACDGKGHVLSKRTTTFPDPDTRSVKVMTCTNLYDVPNNKVVTYRDGGPGSPMPMTDASHYVVTDKDILRYNHKLIGTRVIDGHPCHGWQIIQVGYNIEVWIGDDIRFLVRSTETGYSYGTRTVSRVLKSWSDQSPQASLFAVPDSR